MDILGLIQRIKQMPVQDAQNQLALMTAKQGISAADAQNKYANGGPIMWNATPQATGNYQQQDDKGNWQTQPIAGAPPSTQGLLNTAPQAPGTSQQDFDAQRIDMLRKALPQTFMQNDANVAMMGQRMNAMGLGDSAPPTGQSGSAQQNAPPMFGGISRDTAKTLLAIDPTGKSLSDVIAKNSEQSPQQKILTLYNSMPDGAPGKSDLGNIIKKEGGIETDANKIAETRANTDEKHAQTDLARQKAELLNSTKLDDDTLDRVYQGVRAGQKISDIVPNIGRGTQGAAQSTAIQNYITKRMHQDNLSQGQMAAMGVNLKAQTAAASFAAKRGAGVDMGAYELDYFGDQALDTLKSMDNSKFVPWNKLVNMGDEQLSDPTLAAYKTQLQGLKGAYASVISRGGIPSVEAQHKADQLLSAATGPDAVKAIIGQMQKEARAVRASSSAVQSGIGSAVAGPGSAPPQPSPASAQPTLPPGMVKQVGTLKGKPVYVDAQGKQHVDMGQ